MEYSSRHLARLPVSLQLLGQILNEGTQASQCKSPLDEMKIEGFMYPTHLAGVVDVVVSSPALRKLEVGDLIPVRCPVFERADTEEKINGPT